MMQLSSNEINIALLALGGLVVVLGLLSGFLKQRLYLSDPIVALLIGVMLSPSVFGWIDLAHWGKPEIILEQGARLAIAIQLMGVALRLPKAYPLRQWKSLTVLLGPIMLLMWLSSSLLVYLTLGLPSWEAMLIGAVITPTDPVVSTSVVTGKVAEQNLPGRIRNLISAESAANDGLAYPFVLLFTGWFGPIGVAALFYAFLSLRKTGLESPWVVGSLIICASIFAHGLTAVPFAQLYKKHHLAQQN